jgi:hypothetical protein
VTPTSLDIFLFFKSHSTRGEEIARIILTMLYKILGFVFLYFMILNTPKTDKFFIYLSTSSFHEVHSKFTQEYHQQTTIVSSLKYARHGSN